MNKPIWRLLGAALLFVSAACFAETATIISVSDSANDGNGPTNTYDNDLSTRWSSKGDGQWIQYDIGEVRTVTELAVAFFRGDQRTADLVVETSVDGNVWTEVFNGSTTQLTLDYQQLAIDASEGRYVRLTGYGNSLNTWNSFTEVEIAVEPVNVSSATSNIVAVIDNVGEVQEPSYSFDGDYGTRWGSKGDGQWIQYDLGETKNITELAVAFYKGDQRYASVDVATSEDGVNWQSVWSGQQVELTLALQPLGITDSQGRYLRITGYGNTVNSWITIAEVSISADVIDVPEAPANAVMPAGDGWVYCAKEKSTCEFSGTREVAYGQYTSFYYGNYTGGVSCKNTVFGDPISGKSKYCWTRAAILSDHVITINAADLQQQITLMGGDMERSQFFLQKAKNSQEIANWYYSDVNFQVSRVSYDRKQELTEGSPNMAFYNDAVASMQMVKNANPNVVFWATLKSDYDGYGTTNNLPDWIYTGGGYNGGSYDSSQLNADKYARFLADYLKHMNDNGVPIGYLSVSKEWIQVLSVSKEAETIQALNALLATSAYAGVPVPKYSGPSGWGTSQSASFISSAINKGTDSLYAGVSTHSYDNASETTWGNLIRMSNAAGLPVWHTESPGGGGRYYGEETPLNTSMKGFVLRCMWYRQGLQGELFFENFSRGVSAETRAVYFTSGNSGQRLRMYYLIKQFANNAVNSHYIASSRIGLADDVDTMAFRRDNKLIVWVINNSDVDYQDVYFAVDGSALDGDTLSRTEWNETDVVTGVESSLSKHGSSAFIDSIAAKTMVTYEFEVVQ